MKNGDDSVELLAIITARGGSKRIPRKNIKFFLGKPMIAYSIQSAFASKLFSEIMVSTEDKEIAKISYEYGAKVPFYRSERTADDFATTADVLCEVLECYKKKGRIFEWICCLYPTAPFVTAEKLVESWNVVKNSNANALTPVVEFSYPPQRSFNIDNGEYLKYNWPENMNKRSQDLEPFYHDVGQFYFLKVDEFLKTKSLLLDKTIPYIIKETEMQDIDNEEDWQLAEIKYKYLQANK